MGRNRRVISKSALQTQSFGAELARLCGSNSILCLFGDLGAGKTTLIKGIVSQACGIASEDVNSPTFIYLNIYDGKIPVYHFDLYRLHECEEFLSLGFQEYFSAGGICCIEWSERIKALVPEHAIALNLEFVDETTRLIEVCDFKTLNF